MWKCTSIINFTLDFLLFGNAIASIVVVSNLEEFKRNAKNCACFTRSDPSVVTAPVLILSLIVLLRVFHIILLLGYMVFCLPCACMPDSCCLKPAWMRTSGRSIIERVEKAGWVMSEREEGVAR